MLEHSAYALNSYNGYQNLSYIKVSSGNFRERGDHNIQWSLWRDCLLKYFSFKTREKSRGLLCSPFFTLHEWTGANEKKKKTYAQQSFTASASRGRRFSPFYIIRSLSRLRLSRGLDKTSPKRLGKDKPWLELAVAWISPDRIFCIIYTECSRLI